MFQEIISQIGILLLIVLVGVLARFWKILTEAVTRDLNKLVIGLTLPILYFYVLVAQTSREVLISSWYLPLLAVGIVLTGAILAYCCSRFIPHLFTPHFPQDSMKAESEGTGSVLSRQKGAGFISAPNPQKKTFLYLSSFTNCGFLAIPLALFLFGQEGVVRVVIFNLGFSVLIWTLGVSILRGGSAPFCRGTGGILKRCGIFNPGTIALALGFLGVALGVKLPYIIDGAFGLIGGITIPLAMLIIGGILAGQKFHKRISFKLIVPLVLIRLLIIPALALGIGKLFSFPSPILGIFVLQAGMPSASTTPLFVQRYGGDPDLAGSGVFFTHLLSIVTVPFWISLI
ncbi:MAG: AEC family transporter [Candidatus Ratteibacteria bacterium]|nr:AEC family transporter [Candidatus Ratteibacteria bacterium]